MLYLHGLSFLKLLNYSFNIWTDDIYDIIFFWIKFVIFHRITFIGFWKCRRNWMGSVVYNWFRFADFWYWTYSSSFPFVYNCFKTWVFFVCVKGDETYSTTSLIKDIRILSNPLEQLLPMFFISFSISTLFICSSINYSIGKFSGTDLIKVLMSENLVGDFSVTHLAVLLKNLLISSTLSLMVVVLGFNIRSIVLQMSLLFFEFKTL